MKVSPPAHLILGGRRSGKSAFAEQEARATGLPCTYVATSRVYDSDQAARIAEHRARRQGQGWTLVEVPNPLELQATLVQLAPHKQVVLVDCLAMWLNNLFLDAVPVPELRLPEGPATLLLVSGEVGLGLHAETALGRRYADALGILNQHIAAQVPKVSFIAAGLPLSLK